MGIVIGTKVLARVEYPFLVHERPVLNAETREYERITFSRRYHLYWCYCGEQSSEEIALGIESIPEINEGDFCHEV